MSLLRINRHPSPRQLLVFGVTWLLFLGAISVTLWARGKPTPAAICGGLAVVVPLAGMLFPGWLRYVYLGLTYAAYPIGFVVSHVVLAGLYYLVLTPIGCVMRLGGYDPLARRFERKSPSYWHRRPNPRASASYLRQS